MVGGLSSWAYDEARDVYYALSDDQGGTSPPRAPRPGSTRFGSTSPTARSDAGDVTVWTSPRCSGREGQPFPARSLDPEGLTLTRDDTLIITSEGISLPAIPPFVREFDLSGRAVRRERPFPRAFTPSTSTRCTAARASATTSASRRCRRPQRPVPVRRRRERARAGRTGGDPGEEAARRACCATGCEEGSLDRQYVYSTSRSPRSRCRPGGSRSTGSSSCCR